MKLNTIILIDDDEVSNQINQAIISKLDICNNLVIFPNAVQGLNYFKEVCTFEDCPELILLDLKMPVLDGFDYIREFNKYFEHFRKMTKLVLVTSSNIEKDREMAMSLGFDDYIVKPLSFHRLEEVLKKHFHFPSVAY